MERAQFGIIYTHANKGQLALQTLRHLQQLGHLNVEDGAVLVRQTDGQLVVVEATSKLDLTHPKYALAGIVGNVAGVLGVAPLGPAMLVAAPFWAAVGTAATLGHDIIKQRDVPRGSLRYKTAEMLPAGSSAVVVEVDIINLEATLHALAGLGTGKIVHQSLPIHIYKQLGTALTN